MNEKDYSISEEDTFRHLKRKPFDIVYKEFINCVWYSDALKELENSGWTIEEFNDAKASRNHKLLWTPLKTTYLGS